MTQTGIRATAIFVFPAPGIGLLDSVGVVAHEGDGPGAAAPRCVAGQVDEPPTVVVGQDARVRAIVEGQTVDSNGNQCPTYTDLRVTPPNMTTTVTVDATIDTFSLQVHPLSIARSLVRQAGGQAGAGRVHYGRREFVE